ncbi:hypothetical protein JTE90_028942 [Oedothorax gibbosus]|uniref:Uncharacterized protein n=1 Tax=Oedothorax gibbosus TaxID=931172 RepID=A0AAV6VIS2_9ARAC|nr:hypothetical protein JTE90_028942 [Oedothorax gibbosus]
MQDSPHQLFLHQLHSHFFQEGFQNGLDCHQPQDIAEELRPKTLTNAGPPLQFVDSYFKNRSDFDIPLSPPRLLHRSNLLSRNSLEFVPNQELILKLWKQLWLNWMIGQPNIRFSSVKYDIHPSVHATSCKTPSWLEERRR